MNAKEKVVLVVSCDEHEEIIHKILNTHNAAVLSSDRLNVNWAGECFISNYSYINDHIYLSFDV
jgi:hypothetical protein